MEAIASEMKNVNIAFEIFQGEVIAIPPNYAEVECHMIFDIKMGETFRRKACICVSTSLFTSTIGAININSKLQILENDRSTQNLAYSQL